MSTVEPPSGADPFLPTPSVQTSLLDRIVASPQFRRATRLRELLLFIAQHSLREGSAPLHEQEIGAAVFDRPPGYDTGVDNIVRVNATELRKRLDLYFATEGAREPIVVEMPRGAYTLLFRPRLDTPAHGPAGTSASPATEPVVIALPEVETVPESPVAIPADRSWTARLLFALAAFLLCSCGYLLWRNAQLRDQLRPWQAGTALRAFWAPFMESGETADVVLADTSFAMAQDIEHRSIPLASYLNYDYKRLDSLPGLSADRRADLQVLLDRNNGSVGDYIVAAHILELDHTGSKLRLSFARDYSAEALKTNSAILIGSRQSNPWVELFDKRMNFAMDYNEVLHTATFHNRQPAAGEQTDYAPAGAAHEAGLSVIAFMPALSHSGAALVLEGTNSQATRAAGEFITSDASLSAFLSTIHRNDFPYFEILLENSELTGTPLRSHVLTYRLYPRNSSDQP